MRPTGLNPIHYMQQTRDPAADCWVKGDKFPRKEGIVGGPLRRILVACALIVCGVAVGAGTAQAAPAPHANTVSTNSTLDWWW
jgi:hypothetical protein